MGLLDYFDGSTVMAIVGDSHEKVASDLALEDDSDAHTLVHEALRSANRRYYSR